MTLPLVSHFPGTAGLPRVELCTLPTALEVLEPEGMQPIWVKRDDLTSTLYGGNKVRKLEFLLGHALAENREEDKKRRGRPHEVGDLVVDVVRQVDRGARCQ